MQRAQLIPSLLCLPVKIDIHASIIRSIFIGVAVGRFRHDIDSRGAMGMTTTCGGITFVLTVACMMITCIFKLNGVPGRRSHGSSAPAARPHFKGCSAPSNVMVRFD